MLPLYYTTFFITQSAGEPDRADHLNAPRQMYIRFRPFSAECGLWCIMTLKQILQKRSLYVSHLFVKTYVEASRAVEQLGILPLSGFIPAHPSLDSITEPAAWHTGTDTDPWHWRDRFASEGIAAYGRFIGSRPILIAQGVFPLVKCLLASPPNGERSLCLWFAGSLDRANLRDHPEQARYRGKSTKKIGRYAGQS